MAVMAIQCWWKKNIQEIERLMNKIERIQATPKTKNREEFYNRYGRKVVLIQSIIRSYFTKITINYLQNIIRIIMSSNNQALHRRPRERDFPLLEEREFITRRPRMHEEARKTTV
ncbi:uncharacterized protein [Centruroides vittatus]|uniref:uncharacterized protein n=1 Tax=Centruroides vittatus TaxID=120091 RepID=UPI00350FF6CC